MAAADDAKLKEAFVANEGYWSEGLEKMLQISPGFFEVYAGLMAVPSKTGRLTPKVRELIGVAINAAATHLNADACRRHMENAVRWGATCDEIAEAVQLSAVLGQHTMSIGIPLLIDELRKADRLGDLPAGGLSAEQQALKAEFIRERGYWKDHNEAILKVAPDYVAAYKDYSSYPWRTGSLEPKVREFIYIAIDVSTTHLYELGARVHIQNALKHGATAQELVDVMLVTSLLGMQTGIVAFPILCELFGS
jgi:alkylhydroperoxidase/carboxymuconolactone decarboxylase family protein YurZ